jgi:hypothetical protein
MFGGSLNQASAEGKERHFAPPLDILVQTTLDRILDAQSTHCADAHGGEVTENVDCRTCVALFDAVSAARIAAVETTTPPKRTAQTRTRTTRKG